MYFIFGILFMLCLIIVFVTHSRRKSIIRKLHCMLYCDKVNLLNYLMNPFGFSYLPKEDIVTSMSNPWQKEFGYTALFDTTAPHFNMVFDCEPVYFNFDNRTWLMEFWKGQYGINIGCEVGIYRADCILSPDQYDKALFHAVPEDELFPISLILNFKGCPIFSVSRPHWWLTGFKMGAYCFPEDLVLDASVTFPNEEMLFRFAESLQHMGYNECELHLHDLTASFLFSLPHSRQSRLYRRLSASFSQRQNRIFCRLFQLFTQPFTCTVDRILFLYYFLPFSFRHLIRFKRNRKQQFSKKFRRRL